MNLEQIAQLGVAGLSVWCMYKLSSNHVEHNTKATEDLREAIQELIIFLKNEHKS